MERHFLLNIRVNFAVKLVLTVEVKFPDMHDIMITKVFTYIYLGWDKLERKGIERSRGLYTCLVWEWAMLSRIAPFFIVKLKWYGNPGSIQRLSTLTQIRTCMDGNQQSIVIQFSHLASSRKKKNERKAREMNHSE